MSRVGVKNFIKWVNEIHRWGLTVHGPGCERDVKVCMGDRTGFRISDIGLDGEEDVLDIREPT